MDISKICPVCLREDAVYNGRCRFCGANANVDIPAGVLRPGVILNGRYMTGLFLGVGGFGAVYRALDLRTRTTYAIKEYCPTNTSWCSRQTGSSQVMVSYDYRDEFAYGLKHFRGEAEILSQLQSIPQIVRFYGFFEDNNTGYYLMEYLQGQTLLHYLNAHGNRLSFDDAVRTLMPAILALYEVHKHGTTHRDISPDNIYLCHDGSLRLIDFGAAASDVSRYANSFMPVEKEGYSPPEQHTLSSKGVDQDCRSDEYAMAGTLYRCVIGQRPPVASSRQAGDPLEFEHSGLSPAQIQVIEKAMSLSNSQRYPDVLEFARALLGCVGSGTAQALKTAYPILGGVSQQVSYVPGGSERSVIPAEIHEDQSLVIRTIGPERDTEDNRKKVVTPSLSFDETKGKRTAAYFLDLFIFQGLPLALGMLSGGETIPLWLILGIMLAALTGFLMTNSSIGGSPGEYLCNLRVTDENGRKPDTRQILLYCLLRSLWPLMIVDSLSYTFGKKSFLEMVSGCHSRASAAPTQVRTVVKLVITHGYFSGSSMVVEPGKQYVFGRDPERCDIVFPMMYNTVSREQFSAALDGSNRLIITNHSSNGTRVDQRLLKRGEAAVAANGSLIRFAQEGIVVSYDSEER